MPKKRRTLAEWKEFNGGGSVRNVSALVKELQSRNYSDERIANVLYRQAQMARELPTKRTFEVKGVRTKRKRPQYRFFNDKPYQLFGVAQNGSEGKPTVQQLARTKQLAELIRSYGSNVRVIQWRDEIGLYVRDNPNWRRDPRINWNANQNQVQRIGGVQIFPKYRPEQPGDVYTEVYPRGIPIDSLYRTGTDTPSLRDRQWDRIPLEPTIANQWQYPVIYNKKIFDDWEDALKADANLFENKNPTEARGSIDMNRAKRFDKTNANKERKMLLIHDPDGSIGNYGFLTRTEAAEILFNMGIYPIASRFDEKFREDQRKLKQLSKGYFGKSNIRDAERLTTEMASPSPRSDMLYSLIDLEDISSDAETFLEAIGVDIGESLQNQNLGKMLEPKELTNPEQTARAYQAFVFALINEYGLDGDEVINMIETQGITERDLLEAFEPSSLFQDSKDFDSMIVGNPEEPTQREIEMIRKWGQLNFFDGADFETIDNPTLVSNFPPPKDSPLYWNTELSAPPEGKFREMPMSFVNKMDKQTIRDQKKFMGKSLKGASASLAEDRLSGGMDETDVQREFFKELEYETFMRLPSGEIGNIQYSDSFPEEDGESEYNENPFVEITGFRGNMVGRPLNKISTLDVVSWPDWREYFAGDYEGFATISPSEQNQIKTKYPTINIFDPLIIGAWNYYLNNSGQDIKDEMQQIGGDSTLWLNAYKDWLDRNNGFTM